MNYEVFRLLSPEEAIRIVCGLGQQTGSFTLLYYPNPEWQDNWESASHGRVQARNRGWTVRARPDA
jgi:hypothetical protein